MVYLTRTHNAHTCASVALVGAVAASAARAGAASAAAVCSTGRPSGSDLVGEDAAGSGSGGAVARLSGPTRGGVWARSRSPSSEWKLERRIIEASPPRRAACSCSSTGGVRSLAPANVSPPGSTTPVCSDENGTIGVTRVAIVEWSERQSETDGVARDYVKLRVTKPSELH